MTGTRKYETDPHDEDHLDEDLARFASDKDMDTGPWTPSAEGQWREWMGVTEAVLFASSSVVSRKVLQRLVGEGVSLDLLIADIQAELKGRPYEIVTIGDGWIFRTKPAYAGAIREAARTDGGDDENRPHEASEMEMAVLCAIAYHQPISRDELKDIFGKEISRDLINRLRHQQMIANGPKAPRPGAPQTFVTTREFLARFDLQSLRDLPEMEESGDV